MKKLKGSIGEVALIAIGSQELSDCCNGVPTHTRPPSRAPVLQRVLGLSASVGTPNSSGLCPRGCTFASERS